MRVSVLFIKTSSKAPDVLMGGAMCNTNSFKIVSAWHTDRMHLGCLSGNNDSPTHLFTTCGVSEPLTLEGFFHSHNIMHFVVVPPIHLTIVE